MGCAKSSRIISETAANVPALLDPRWDDAGFNAWANEAKVQFTFIKYLRELHASGCVMPAAQWVPRNAFHFGAPPSGAEIFYVVHMWLSTPHPDPHGEHLADLVHLLRDADDSDLVLLDFMSRPQKYYTRNGDGSVALNDDGTLATFDEGDQRLRLQTRIRTGVHTDMAAYTDLTPEEERRAATYSCGIADRAWTVTYSALRTVVLHRVPESAAPDRRRRIHESVWASAELMLSAYCQRIVNAADPEVQAHFSPDMLINPVGRLREGLRSGVMRLSHKNELEEIIIPGLCRSMSAMVPVYSDHVGFQSFCVRSRIGWIKVEFIHTFVELLEHSVAGELLPLFPRRQELPRGTFYEGMPPPGVRKFVVSHGWACEHHPTPGSEKIRRLATSLRAAGACAADAIFFDYSSLYQRGRQAQGAVLDMPIQRDWTLEEQKCFRTALFEMSRMYAFSGCEVLVLPQLEKWRSFPGSATSPPVQTFSKVKQRDCEHSPLWGWVNNVPYQNRGWCAAEFSCALKAGIIANLADPDVQSVLASRNWPTTVAGYKAMMEETTESGAHVVEFTARGDREYVAYLFFKMSFDLQNAVAKDTA